MSWEEITLSPILPTWLIVFILCLGILALVFQYGFLQNRVGRKRGLWLSLLRLGAFFLLIGFFLNPTATARLEKKASPSLALLVDTSSTMGLPGREGKGSRLDEARGLLLEGQKPLLKSLSDRYEVQVYALGESLRLMEAGEIPALKAGGKKGDLAGALKIWSSRNVLPILLSDGRMGWKDHSASTLPLVAIPVGDPEIYKDVWIHSVKAPALAFRGREVRVEGVVRSKGFTPMNLPISLKEGNKLLTAQSIRIMGGPAGVPFSFSFTPEEVGQRHFSLSVPPQSGESSLLNNALQFSLKVVKDKIRILMVSGHPSLNYRFMRMALKSDPSIDLLSFVILRTPTDILNVPLQEQSLIPFPVETLFSKELSSFDLLILDDFPLHLYVKPIYLERVRDFVKGGGGLAMIGGSHLLDGGRYSGTPMEEILPIAVAGKGDYGRENPWGVKLTRFARSHPITRIDPVEKENLALWRDMPALDGINRVTVKTSATVLLEGGDPISRPILTVGPYGQGRVLVLATDYSWKWYMGGVAQGKGNWAYHKFMERTVRWLTRDPSLDPVQITLPEEGGGIGERKEIRVRVRSEEGSSAGQKGLFFFVVDPQGRRIDSELKPSGPSGEYLGYFIPERPGTYRLKVETSGGSMEESVAYSEPLGDRDGVPDHERLKRIVEAVGGKFLSPREDLLPEIFGLAEKRESRYVEEKRTPLWGHFLPLCLILALLSGEWYLRRRWGLI
jgi:uncharacterized membrane protein